MVHACSGWTRVEGSLWTGTASEAMYSRIIHICRHGQDSANIRARKALQLVKGFVAAALTQEPFEIYKTLNTAGLASRSSTGRLPATCSNHNTLCQAMTQRSDPRPRSGDLDCMPRVLCLLLVCLLCSALCLFSFLWLPWSCSL